MAKTVYTGLQGHGKSYEVVRGVICPNVAKGRRVVTNVAGLQVDKIKAYCVDKLGADPEKLGEIVAVTNERITEPDFFPEELPVGPEWDKYVQRYTPIVMEGTTPADWPGDSLHQALVERWKNKSIVQGGDVVIIDECWRFYVAGQKLPDGHLTFFRMHRHFTHPITGQACDVVLIVQDITDLQRKVLATVEKSFLMKKHKDLGLTDRYVVSVFAGKRQILRALTEEHQHKYNKEIFELYSSYSQSTATEKKEEAADKRGNLLNRKIFKFGIPLAILGIAGGVYNTYKFFHPESVKTPAGEVAAAGAPGQVAGQAAAPKKPDSGVSDTWRLIGTIRKPDKLLFIIADTSGRVRYVSDPPAFKATQSDIELALPNAEIVTYWSGSTPSLMPGFRK